MKKKVLLSSLVILTALLGYNICYAANTTSAEAETAAATKQDAPLQKKIMQTPLDKEGLPPFEVKHRKGHPGMHPYYHPSKEEMAAKKAEIEKRLGLTAEQKQKLEKNKDKDKAKIKPIMDKIKKDKQELKNIYADKSLTPEQKDKKAEKVKKDLYKLKSQADKCRKENMKHFESVLTKEQKAEFEKIKDEQRQEMEQRKLDFEKNHPDFKGHRPPKFDGKKPDFGEKPPVKPLPVPDIKK
ncbi:Spy/CpxP family protein refolding chaperone [bacterium]|nr:Spy/CpxP family protein refolding chaperone [bacterium]